MATHLSAAKGQHSHRASFRGRTPVCGIRGSVLHVAALRLRVVVHSIEGLASNRRLLSSVERVIRNGRKREAPQRGQANSCAFRGSWENLVGCKSYGYTKRQALPDALALECGLSNAAGRQKWKTRVFQTNYLFVEGQVGSKCGMCKLENLTLHSAHCCTKGGGGCTELVGGLTYFLLGLRIHGNDATTGYPAGSSGGWANLHNSPTH